LPRDASLKTIRAVSSAWCDPPAASNAKELRNFGAADLSRRCEVSTRSRSFVINELIVRHTYGNTVSALCFSIQTRTVAAASDVGR
jgi:hypothetical protein